MIQINVGNNLKRVIKHLKKRGEIGFLENCYVNLCQTMALEKSGFSRCPLLKKKHIFVMHL